MYQDIGSNDNILPFYLIFEASIGISILFNHILDFTAIYQIVR